jgi:hypothetical protein
MIRKLHVASESVVTVSTQSDQALKRSPLTLAVVAAAFGLPMLAQSANAGGFIEDSKATLSARNFWINVDNRDVDRAGVKEWGQGFVLRYQSGFTEGPVGFGLDAIGMWGFRLDGGGDVANGVNQMRLPGTNGVFPKDGNGPADNFGNVGVTGKMRISKSVFEYGTLMPKLPVIQGNDSRLLPQTFEGGQITVNDIDKVTLVGGRIEHTKTRASSDQVGLATAGRQNGADTNEFFYAGADYKVTKDLMLQYYYGNMQDFYKQHFLGLVHNWALPAGTLKTDLRYFRSTSDGMNETASGRAAGYVSNGYYGNGVTRGKVDNNAWSGLFTYSLKGHEISAGYQQLTGSSDFPFINTGDGSTSYLITNMQIGKFQHAGERTWLAKYGYDFANVGVPGLKASIAYVYGDNVDTRFGDQTQHETNVRLDYVIQSGPLKNLGFTWQGAQLRSDSGIKGVGRTGAGAIERNQDENRLIVSYTLPLL